MRAVTIARKLEELKAARELAEQVLVDYLVTLDSRYPDGYTPEEITDEERSTLGEMYDQRCERDMEYEYFIHSDFELTCIGGQNESCNNSVHIG